MITERVDRILAELIKLREELDPRIEEEHFEIEYRQAVARNLDVLLLIGADVSSANRRHKLSVAYITLSVAKKRPQSFIANTIQRGNVQEEVENDIVSVISALAHSNRLLVRGEAGSGKTTLLQWIAVRAATRTFKGELTDWNNYLPFYIRLRQYAQSQLPAPEAFLRFAAQEIAGIMPKGWIHKKLQSGRAIVLIDGIDEIPAAQREEVHMWLDRLVGTFPKAHFIVTSRPYAIQEGWMNHQPFENAELQPMELPDISFFIDHWHQAVREELQREEEKNELEPLADYLNEQIRQNRTLRNLAASPLLCAMLCALSRERRQHLPVNRIELYKACCQLLLERRDKESRIDLSDYSPLMLGQKERVLQDLAYWMIQEQLSEADVAQIDERIAKQLAHMPNLPSGTNAIMVRRQLVERSNLLREPVEKKIDFAHRTFEEFFAAQAALDASDIKKLIANGRNIQWREVIILAAGLASKALCEQIIVGLIKRGDEEERHRHQILLLAVSCLEAAVQLQPEIKIAVEQRLSQLVPPNNMTEAKAMAAAGELAIKHLVKKEEYSALQCINCIQSLSLIGGDAALSVLESYANDGHETVIQELFKVWSSFEYELSLRHGLQKTLSLKLENTLSPDQLFISSLSRLNLSGIGRPNNLSLLVHLPNLTQLYLSECEQLTDLSPLVHLINLSQLNLSECWQINDFSPLAHLTNLTQLNLSQCWRVTDLSPLAHLFSLSQLNLSRCYQLSDLSPLAHLTNLSELNLRLCEKITDLSPLQGLNKLRIIW